MQYGFLGSERFRLLPIFIMILVVVGFIIVDPFGDGPSIELMLSFAAIGLVARLTVLIIRRRKHDVVYNRIGWFAQKDGWAVDHLTDIVTLLPQRLLTMSGLSFAVGPQRQHVIHKYFDGQLVHLAFVEYYIQGPKKSKELKGMVIAQGKLSSPVLGYVRIIPASNAFLRYLPDVNLESHRFNQDVYLTSDPQKLATFVFSPDTMAWYLDQKIRPYMHIENDRVCILATDDVSFESLETLSNQIVDIIRKIEHSGALEKEPLIR